MRSSVLHPRRLLWPLVIALGLAFWALNIPVFNRWYQTVPLLLAAYVIHFGSQALRSAETSI